MAPMTRMFAGVWVGLRSRRPSGSQALTRPRPCPHAQRPRRLLERLELDEQFVDHPGDALALGGARAPGAADGVELLDEPDGPALARGLAPQLLEVGADLAVGLPVEHRLEGRRRDEEEGHAGLGGHGLGHVRLARPGRALEEDGLAGGAAHLLVEGPVGQEEVERLGDLLDQPLGPAHVVEGHGQLVGPVEDVGRPSGRQKRDDHDGESSRMSPSGMQVRGQAEAGPTATAATGPGPGRPGGPAG